MRIALNAATLRGFGSGAVGRRVLSNLIERGEHDVLAWVPAEWTSKPDGPRAKILETHPGALAKFTREIAAMPARMGRWRADVLFSLGDAGAPRPGRPHLLMVQQAFLAYDPADWGFQPPRAFALKMSLMDRYFRLGLSGVTQLTVQSNSMRERIAARHRLDSSRIAVVASALDPVWHETMSAGKGGRPRVCYVASGGPHKNHALLAPMMAALKTRHPDLRCHLTVHAEDVPALVKRAASLGVSDRFVYEGPLTQRETATLVAGSTLVVMPSALESFGLTFYEAMAAGCPIVASDRPFSREACGDAAVYADGAAPDSFAVAVSRLLDSRTEREQLSARGHVRVEAQCPSWPAVVSRYVTLLQELR